MENKLTLKEFIENFVEPNTLIRLWHKTHGGHQALFDDNDMVEMEWRIKKGKGIYKGLEDAIVIGVTDILVGGHYKEAVNIVIWR